MAFPSIAGTMIQGARQVVIRADASRSIGTGHVMRCLTLARTLRGHDVLVRFVCREHEGHLCDLVEAAGFEVARLAKGSSDHEPYPGAPAHAAWLGTSWEDDARLTEAAIGVQGADWIVVDHYALDARWQRRLRGRTRRIMVIDDLADREHDCDVLLDQNFFADGRGRYCGIVPEPATLLLGPFYSLLAPDYEVLRRRTSPRQGAPEKILVSFGGADHQGLTRRAVEALLSLEGGPPSADVILSSAAADFAAIREMLAGNEAIRLHDRVASLAPFVLGADFAIGAGGATHWERMCLGLPALVITMAENQRQIARQLADQNLIRWLGDAFDVSSENIRDAVEVVMREGLDPQWSSRCMALVDGLGAQRVAAVLGAGPAMDVSVRHAELRDEGLLLEWANDPLTRANGYNPAAIKPEDHARWFRGRLRNPLGCRLFIVETIGSVPVGQVRFDDRGGEWEVSYSVAPEFRGRGVGRPMMEAALRELGYEASTIIGQVKPGNIASRRIFEALGFTLRSSDPTRLVFERR